MATVPPQFISQPPAPEKPPSPAQIFVRENHFYRRVALVMALLVILGFGLFNALGFNDITALPLSTHLHGAVMGGWVLLFVVQNYLGTRADLSLHRKLGWVGVVLTVLAVVTAWNTSITATQFNRAPPIFDQSYFLALGLVQPVIFAAFVGAAIALRKRTDWHRRLMLGAIIIVLEPALGRLLLLIMFPAMGGPEVAVPLLAERTWLFPLVEMATQAAIVATIMLQDRAIRTNIHPALWWLMAGIFGMYALVWMMSAIPAFAAQAQAMTGSAL